MPEGQVLEFNRVTKRFGSVTAVSDLSVRVEPGRVTGFLGPNGAGKTTSLRMMLGQIRPSEGTATIGGQSYAELRHPLRTVGAVLEETAFRPRRTAQRQLMIAAKANGIPAERVDEVLRLVGLHDDAETRLGSYSLGMRQRFAVAGALLGDPGVLVLDEPANGLDPEGIRWMRLMMRRLADEGRTVLLSSHVLSEIEQVADDVVVLAKGHAVYAGGIDDLASPAGGAVIVDAVNRAQLITALSAAKLEFDVLRSGVTVRNSDSATVGAITAEAGVPLITLQQRGPSLEEVFLDLIHGRRGDGARGAEATPAVADPAPAVADAAGESADAAPDAGAAGAGAFAAGAGAVGAGALGAASLFGPIADAEAPADAAEGSADLVESAADANDDPEGSTGIEDVEEAPLDADADVTEAPVDGDALVDGDAPVADEAAGSAELIEDAADANDDPDGCAAVEGVEVSDAAADAAHADGDTADAGADSAGLDEQIDAGVDAGIADVDAEIDAAVTGIDTDVTESEADVADVDAQAEADVADVDSDVEADVADTGAAVDADSEIDTDVSDGADVDAGIPTLTAEADAETTHDAERTAAAEDEAGDEAGNLAADEHKHEDDAELVAGLFGDADETPAETDDYADSPAVADETGAAETESDLPEADRSAASDDAEERPRAGNPFLSRLFGRGAPAMTATAVDGFAQDDAARADDSATADVPAAAAETVADSDHVQPEDASESEHDPAEEIYAEPASDASIASLWAPRSAASGTDADTDADLETGAETGVDSPEESADATQADDATRPPILPLATESVTLPVSTEQPTFTELITGLPASVAEGIGEPTAATEAIPVFTGLSSDEDEDSAVDDDEDPRLAAMRTSLSSAASRFFNGPAPDYPYSRGPKEEPADESDSPEDKPENHEG